jgi:hypothetical protein
MFLPLPPLSQAKPPALATRPDESYPLGTCTFHELSRVQQEFSFTSPLEETPKLYACGKYQTLAVVKPTSVQRFQD